MESLRLVVESPSSTTLLAGMPGSWTPAFVTALATPGHAFATLKADNETIVDSLRTIPVASGWTDIETALTRDRETHPPIATAVIGALATPQATSLMEALNALETAVVQNDNGPMQLIAALLQTMLPQQSGRIVIVTFDPRSITKPDDAAIRGSSRGILTYLESLRPALKRRGIAAGLLLISPTQRHHWHAATNAALVAHAVAECLQKATLQRVIKLS